jgi:hypothetical protein
VRAFLIALLFASGVQSQEIPSYMQRRVPRDNRARIYMLVPEDATIWVQWPSPYPDRRPKYEYRVQEGVRLIVTDPLLAGETYDRTFYMVRPGHPRVNARVSYRQNRVLEIDFSNP